MRKPTRRDTGKAAATGEVSEPCSLWFRRGIGDGMHERGSRATREAPWRGRARDQPDAREGQAGRGGVAERPVCTEEAG